MDIQKERKAFLEHWYENNLHFDDEDKFQKPAWDAWQAAKAQAMPEGFVLVPREPTLKMSVAYQKNAIAPVSSLSISGYKAMIEAQE